MAAPQERASRPRPIVDLLTSAYWEGAKRGELVIQRCRSCGNFDHPPFPECTRCRSPKIAFEAVSGRGWIYERGIVTAPVVRGFEDRVPYACLVVELDEQPGLFVLGNLVGADASEAIVGRRVAVTFEVVDDELTLPNFVLAGD